jgi:hypothetical protein
MYSQGKIDLDQRDNLIVQDRQLNTIIAIGAIVVIAKFLFF